MERGDALDMPSLGPDLHCEALRCEDAAGVRPTLESKWDASPVRCGREIRLGQFRQFIEYLARNDRALQLYRFWHRTDAKLALDVRRPTSKLIDGLRSLAVDHEQNRQSALDGFAKAVDDKDTSSS